MISATEERIKTNKLLMDICNFNKDLFDTSTLSSDEIRYYNKITDGFNKQIQFFIDWLDSDEAKRIFQDYTRYNEQAFLNIDEYTQEIIENTKLTSDEIINKLYDTGLTNGYKEIRRTKHYNDATKYGLKFLQNYNFSLITNVTEDLKKHIKTQIFNGIVAGETMPEVAQKILHAHETSLTGKTLSARQRAMMIARTETARAMTQGRLQSYANYGVREVKILTAGDNSVCAICREAANKIFPISEAGNLVPFHPLCRCSVMAYIRHGILQGLPDDDVSLINLTPLDFKDISNSSNLLPYVKLTEDKLPKNLEELVKKGCLEFDMKIENATNEFMYIGNLTTGKLGKIYTSNKEKTVTPKTNIEINFGDELIATHNHLSHMPFNADDFEVIFSNSNLYVKFLVVHTPTDVFICQLKENALSNKDIILPRISKCYGESLIERGVEDYGTGGLVFNKYKSDEILNKYMSFRRIRK